MTFSNSYVLSTDSAGIFASPLDWYDVWDFAAKGNNFLGFEAIGWRWIQRLVNEAKTHGFPLAGIHGRMGKNILSSQLLDRFTSAGLNGLLVDTPSLVQQCTSDITYLLLHAPELQFSHHKELLLNQKETLPILFLENHTWPGSSGAALEMAFDLSQEGLKTGIMFDIVHYLRAYNYEKALPEHWHKLLRQLETLFIQIQAFDPSIATGIHLPVGTREEDSLPVDLITPVMWQELARTLNMRPGTLVVIENQQKWLNALLLTPNAKKLQRERNMRIFETLQQSGVILY